MDFREFLIESIPHQKGAESTQCMTTIGTYRKCAEILKGKLKEGSIVLDYGAGYGEGANAMKEVFGDLITVETLETSPKEWKPMYTNSDQINKKYDAVVCFNVLNVLEPDIRGMVTKDILSLVKEGGYVIIGTRAWEGDVARNKNIKPAKEDKAVWVIKSVGEVYQKGFDGSELLDYVNSFNSGITFRKIGDLAKNTVIGRKE